MVQERHHQWRAKCRRHHLDRRTIVPHARCSLGPVANRLSGNEIRLRVQRLRALGFAGLAHRFRMAGEIPFVALHARVACQLMCCVRHEFLRMRTKAALPLLSKSNPAAKPCRLPP